MQLTSDIVARRSEDRGRWGGCLQWLVKDLSSHHKKKSVLIKDAFVFQYLPPSLATPFLIFKSGLAAFIPGDAVWR